MEDDVAHGRPIPLLPNGPFGVPMPSVVTTSPKQRAAPGRSPSGGGVPLESASSHDDRFRLYPRPETDRGSKDEFSRLYQEYVGTLVNPDLIPRVSGLLAYKFSTPTEKDVYIDHCNYETGNLFEDKGHYEDAHEPGFFQDVVRKDWVKQAARQLEVAQHFGRQLEWWFYEKKSMELARKWFKNAGIEGIILKQVDYPGNDQWPYPPDAKWAKGRQKR